MKLPIIQSLWIGAPLANTEKLCIQSFLDHGHEFHLYVYDEVQGVPAGAVIKDANEILPKDKIFRVQKGGSYAPFSDHFRYALLYKLGGWWVDMDTVCLQPFAFAEEIILHGSGGLFTNTPLRFPPKHPLMLAMQNICAAYKNPHKARFGFVGGPRPLTRMVLKHNLQRHAKPYIYFSPLDTNQWQHIFNDTFAAGGPNHGLFPNTHSVHLSNEALRKAGLDKNARFDSRSLFEQLKRKHNIAPVANATTVSVAEIAEIITRKRLYKFERRAAAKKKAAYLVAIVSIILGGLVYMATG